jgi:hypothetical protein
VTHVKEISRGRRTHGLVKEITKRTDLRVPSRINIRERQRRQKKYDAVNSKLKPN